MVALVTLFTQMSSMMTPGIRVGSRVLVVHLKEPPSAKWLNTEPENRLSLERDFSNVDKTSACGLDSGHSSVSCVDLWVVTHNPFLHQI